MITNEDSSTPAPEHPRHGSADSGSRQGWAVARDGGRPEGGVCTHLAAVVEPPDPGPREVCEECLALGREWVRLRWCTTCGNVGCCDSSRGQHAYGHHRRTGHPIVISLAPDESWAWCYADEVFLVEA
ncbi:UBP-type zinc finger domain-containing protein [Streptomyces sp. NPDC048018]|uniref:UBP-type zinc finger domain-containing protein n=1 Tax=Streptomyces sp. NPDC048018 TaxID=3365499 RepID=UPI003723DEB8